MKEGGVGEADFRKFMVMGKQVRRQMLENSKQPWKACGGKRRSHGNWKQSTQQKESPWRKEFL